MNRERGKDEGEKEEKGPIVSFNDDHRGWRTFDRINRSVSIVLLNIAAAREKFQRERETARREE